MVSNVFLLLFYETIGDFSLDVPLPRLSGDFVHQQWTLQWKTLVHEPACGYIWIHAFAVHAIQTGLHSF